jgi:hypothetical protein
VLNLFLQIPPVKCSQYLYEYPQVTADLATLSRKIAAWELYRQFTTVVYLTEVYRQTDPIFRNLLGRMRDNTFVKEHIDIINTRVVNATTNPASTDVEGLVAVLTNAARIKVTQIRQRAWFKYRAAFDTTGKEFLPIGLCGAYRRNGESIKDSAMLRKLKRSAIGTFRGRPGDFLVAIGMPVIFGDSVKYTNEEGEQQVAAANGSTGRIFGLQFPDGTTFSEQTQTDGQRYLLPSKQVRYVLVQVDNAKFPKFKDLPEGVLPVKPTSQAGDKNLSVISLKQVPLCPNFASTIHKLQSQTLHVLTLAEFTTLEPNLLKLLHGSHLYVLLSRVRTLAGLFMLSPIEQKDIDFFTALLDRYTPELNRLKVLAQLSRDSFPHPCTAPVDFTIPTQDNRKSSPSVPEAPTVAPGYSADNSTVQGDMGKEATRILDKVARSEAARGSKPRTATAKKHSADSTVHDSLLCTPTNHTQFAQRYQYSMDTAPPTGAGVYAGPVDSPAIQATTFSWLYMPLLLNALLSSTSSATGYFNTFMAAMPYQYRLLTCYYRRYFQERNILNDSHLYITPDGPLHFSEVHQEMLMGLPPIPAGGLVKSDFYCEFLGSILMQASHMVSVNGDKETVCCSVEAQLQQFFAQSPHGFPFPLCSLRTCVLCNASSNGVPTASLSSLTDIISCSTSLQVIAMPIQSEPQRRIHAWESNSCYVDVALQTWYHMLHVAGLHYNCVATFWNVDSIPEKIQLAFFPKDLKVCLNNWLQCKLILLNAVTSKEVTKVPSLSSPYIL